jgi:hypothetical protein
MRRIVLICAAIAMMAVTVTPTVACPDDPEARSAYPAWYCR